MGQLEGELRTFGPRNTSCNSKMDSEQGDCDREICTLNMSGVKGITQDD